MKTLHRNILIIVAAVIVVIGIVYGCASTVLSRAATKEVNKMLAYLPEGEASCGAIQIRLLGGFTRVNDLRFSYRTDTLPNSAKTQGIDLHIGCVEVDYRPLQLFKDKRVTVSKISVLSPRVELWMDEEHPERCLPAFMTDTAMTVPSLPVEEIMLNALSVEDASLALHSTHTHLDVAVNGCSVELQDLGYDSAFHFNDSLYRFSLAQAAVTLPDASMKMQTSEISHADQGEVHIGASRIVHNMPKTALGDRVQEPVTWIDMHLKSATLSPLNPIRKALRKDLSVDHIEAEVSFMDIFRDERYKLKHATVMPQRVLMELPVVFQVKDIKAKLDRIHIGFDVKDDFVGHLDLGHIHTYVSHVTNRRGATMQLSGHCPMGTGEVQALFEMTMNDACDFHIHLKGKGINTSFLDGFMRPFTGITTDCMIDSLAADYRGNHLRADGAFRMAYHGFSIKVHKEDTIPFEIITKNAGTINNLGNTLIPHSNPMNKHSQPLAYQVTWKRDEHKPVELYLFGPIIDGIKKTFLPGLYVHLRTKEVND